jgi:hypothetical protein
MKLDGSDEVSGFVVRPATRDDASGSAVDPLVA